MCSAGPSESTIEGSESDSIPPIPEVITKMFTHTHTLYIPDFMMIYVLTVLTYIIVFICHLIKIHKYDLFWLTNSGIGSHS